jgi:hypothetical protein
MTMAFKASSFFKWKLFRYLSHYPTHARAGCPWPPEYSPFAALMYLTFRPLSDRELWGNEADDS